jgi:hypothetical protein
MFLTYMFAPKNREEARWQYLPGLTSGIGVGSWKHLNHSCEDLHPTAIAVPIVLIVCSKFLPLGLYVFVNMYLVYLHQLS